MFTGVDNQRLEKGPSRVAKPSPQQQPNVTKVLPMQLQVGDRLKDETGEWEVIGRPYTTANGKNAHIGVQRVDEPGTADIRTWGAHERLAIRRP